MAEEKARAVAEKHPGKIILAADTVVACGRRILPKAESEEEARHCLMLLSGRRHRVYTAVVVAVNGKIHTRVALTQVSFNRLAQPHIEAYVASGEWKGKAGGYAIQGLAATFIPWISGSYSNVMGLPLADACHLLAKAGTTRDGCESKNRRVSGD
jgi:septum formation protein